jgi:hypothetical protein
VALAAEARVVGGEAGATVGVATEVAPEEEEEGKEADADA